MVKLLLSDDDVRSGTNMARLIDSAAIQAFSSATAHLFLLYIIYTYIVVMNWIIALMKICDS